MELAYSYVKNYASAKYHSCADEPLKSQVNALLSQCQQHNDKLQSRPLTKKGNKQKLANEIAVLLRITEISEQMGEQWRAERSHLGEQIEKIGDNLSSIATASSVEMDDLRATVCNLSERNCELQEQLEQCNANFDMKSRLVGSLQLKLSHMEELIMSLERKLEDANSQLLRKEQWILSLNERKKKCPSANICIVTDVNTSNEVALANSPGYLGEGTSVLTINEKLTLCQILGEFNTLESPVCLSNKFEAMVQKYTLTDKDACSLLRAWVPAPLASQVSAYENDNLDAEGRMKELQRVLKSRDDRGINALQRMRFRRGDDPILFCNQYLSLYKSVYNCPDMSADDSGFIYSMANICYVNYPNRIALRNANSYQSFINILRDWCEESSDGYRSDADISVVSRGTRRKKFIRCYKCHRPGHIQRFCRTPDIFSLIPDDKGISTQDKESIPQEPDVMDNSLGESGNAEGQKEEITDNNGRPPPNSQQPWGTSIPMFAPWTNLPFWLVCSWSQIALPFFLKNMANFVSNACLV
ncbi:posterior protein-like [Bufo bufo]|uniref:posterior protein-like n=1 Tax=Bufo bufo TaxID=8384 RepID=UPI001ABE7619|nr:posterior protein-like [Bufo bufo]